MLKGLVINCRLVITLVMLSLLAACETTVLAPDGQTMLQQFDKTSHEAQYEQRRGLEKNWLIEGKFSFSSPDHFHRLINLGKVAINGIVPKKMVSLHR